MFRAIFSFLVFLFVCTGCSTVTPSVKTNARLKDNSLYALMDRPQPNDASVQLIARCSSVDKYKTTVKGNWKTYWYFTVWKVMEVTEGKWQPSRLSFIYTDTWPTAGSGITLKKPVLPLYLRCLENCVTYFAIDTSKDPPLIVDMKRRSLIPPCEALKPPEWNIPYSAEDIKLRIKIIKSAGEYLNLDTVHGLHITEERSDFYVVEHITDSGIRAVKVDKKNFQADRINIP